MTQSGPAPTVAASAVSVKFAVLAYSLCVLVTSNLLEVVPFGAELRSASIVGTLILALIGVLWALVRGMLLAATIAFVLLTSVWWYLFVYAENSGLAFNVTAGGLYFGGCLCALFAVAFKEGRTGNLIRAFVAVSAFYSAGYIVMSMLWGAGILAVPSKGLLLLAGDELASRGRRLSLSAAPVIFAASIAIMRMRAAPTLSSAAVLALAVAALLISGSRTVTALSVAFLALFGILGFTAISRIVAGSAFLAVLFISIWTISDPLFNPYEFFERDNSALVRHLAVQTVQGSISRYWLTGAGVPSANAGYVYLTSNPTFYPSDIGLIGVMFSHGVLGFATYVYVCVAGIWSHRALGKLSAAPWQASGASLAGTILAVYSFQAPLYLGSSAAVFASLFIALSVSRGSTTPYQA